MKARQILAVLAISAVTSGISVTVYHNLLKKQEVTTVFHSKAEMPVQYAKYDFGNIKDQAGGPVDFTKATSRAVPAVVHIKTKTGPRKIARENNEFNDFLDRFFGSGFSTNMLPEERASGSGVIISENGYIITNDHVVVNESGGIADEINVTLNNGKIYKAELVGKDASTDIAVLKINAKDLPFITLGDSEGLRTGQWVLAVGYPFSLEATVTAGIISATGSRPNANNGRPAKSGERTARTFIQTDAAVNLGSSGGALINTEGELVGINSGILSPTGTYAGYSFAIPVNEMKVSVMGILQAAGGRKVDLQ